MEKLNLYKPASPLQRSGRLQQGKLQGVEDSVSLISTEHEEMEEPKCLQKSTETAAPEPGLYRSEEHAISLSLSDSEGEDDGLPQQSRLVVDQRPSSCTSHDGDRDAQVLLVDADTSNNEDNAQTTAVKVTSMRVPSPVKVVPHFRMDERFSEDNQDWRRFSTNFVNPQTIVKSGSRPEEQGFERPPATVEASSRDGKQIPAGGTVPVPLVEQQAKPATVPSGKRKKGKVVPSRYLTASNTSSQAKLTVTGRKPPSSSATKAKPSKTLTKSDAKTTREGFKIPTGNPRVNRSLAKGSQKTSSQSKGTSSTASFLEDFSSTPVVSAPGMSTSTPYQQAAEGPVTHDGSFMNNFARPTSAAKVSSWKTSSTVPKTTNKGFHMTATEIEVEYTRLIQLMYLDIMSYKALKRQESNAKEQMYQLWKTLQEKKDEYFLMKRKLEEEERNLKLDKALDVQVDCLGPLCSKIPLLEQSYVTMAQAVDATRHEMVLKEILPIRRDEIEAVLTEIELLLGEINAKIRGSLPKVLNFSSSSKVIAEILDKEYIHLDRCYVELSQLIRMQAKCLSLQLEQVHCIP